MNGGWFAIKHGIRKHPIFQGRPDRLGAWVAILDETAYSDTRQDVGGNVVKIRRGQLCASQAMLEDITGLTRQKLRTFLALLEKEGVIETRPATNSTKSRTILTICNYEKYQSQQPRDNQELTKGQPTKTTNKQIPVGADDETPAADPAKIIFTQGLNLLKTAGVAERNARSLLGKWRKQHGDAALIAVLGRVQRESPIDPVAFCQGAFKFQQKTGPRDASGYTDNGAFGLIPERC